MKTPFSKGIYVPHWAIPFYHSSNAQPSLQRIVVLILMERYTDKLSPALRGFFNAATINQLYDNNVNMALGGHLFNALTELTDWKHHKKRLLARFVAATVDAVRRKKDLNLKKVLTEYPALSILTTAYIIFNQHETYDPNDYLANLASGLHCHLLNDHVKLDHVYGKKTVNTHAFREVHKFLRWCHDRTEYSSTEILILPKGGIYLPFKLSDTHRDQLATMINATHRQKKYLEDVLAYETYDRDGRNVVTKVLSTSTSKQKVLRYLKQHNIAHLVLQSTPAERHALVQKHFSHIAQNVPLPIAFGKLARSLFFPKHKKAVVNLFLCVIACTTLLYRNVHEPRLNVRDTIAFLCFYLFYLKDKSLLNKFHPSRILFTLHFLHNTMLSKDIIKGILYNYLSNIYHSEYPTLSIMALSNAADYLFEKNVKEFAVSLLLTQLSTMVLGLLMKMNLLTFKNAVGNLVLPLYVLRYSPQKTLNWKNTKRPAAFILLLEVFVFANSFLKRRAHKMMPLNVNFRKDAEFVDTDRIQYPLVQFIKNNYTRSQIADTPERSYIFDQYTKVIPGLIHSGKKNTLHVDDQKGENKFWRQLDVSNDVSRYEKLRTVHGAVIRNKKLAQLLFQQPSHEILRELPFFYITFLDVNCDTEAQVTKLCQQDPTLREIPGLVKELWHHESRHVRIERCNRTLASLPFPTFFSTFKLFDKYIPKITMGHLYPERGCASAPCDKMSVRCKCKK